jgi:hypothetical protein
MTTYSAEAVYRADIVIWEEANGYSTTEMAASGYTPSVGDIVKANGTGFALNDGASPIGIVVPHFGETLADPITSKYQIIRRTAEVSDWKLNYNSQSSATINAALLVLGIKVLAANSVEII